MIRAALEDLDLSATFAAFLEQQEHGHTAESDAERKLACFGIDLVTRSAELRDVIVPGDRQNLDVAYRRAARLGAYALATMRRIRVEKHRQEESSNEPG